MKFCLENIKDISKYFAGTFVKFNGMRGIYQDGTDCSPAEDLVHSVDRVAGNTISGKRFEDGAYTAYQFILYSMDDAPAPEVEFILPKKSFFNTDNGAYLLYRVPARQYRRGVCAENTSILHLSHAGLNPTYLSHELLNSYIRKPQFYSFAERDKSYTVSRRMAVMGNTIWMDQTTIGSINYETGEISALHLFHAEIEQVLKDRGQFNIKIVPPISNKAKKRKGKDYLPKEIVKEEAHG